MKKLVAVLLFLITIAAFVDARADGFGGAGFIQLTVHQRVAPSPSPVPTLVAGSFAPKGQTPAMPSVSTESPRCLDATWGAGCNVSTQTCIAPTTLAPYQPCQPPLMLFPTGGTSNGTTGQILYTSYASATYPAGEAIIIGNLSGTHQATQANWNTPRSEVTAFSSLASGGSCGASPSVTLTISDSTAANPYATSGPFSTVYINGVTGSVTGVYQSFGWTAGNPNGSFSVVTVGGSAGAWTITYCTSVQVTGTLLNNSDGYSGIVTSPYIALSGSNCGISGNPFSCQVSFLNPHTCASSCVSANTQFIAGQFDDLILNHHFGEQVPLSEQNGTVEPCVIASHISGTPANPAFSVYAELDGGAFVKSPPITDPRGTGASGLSAPPRKVYCAQFNAGSVADGEREITWAGCPIVGFCSRLQSTQAVDAASGASTFFKANNHALRGGTILGIVASPDTQFPVFDWTQSTLRKINGVAGGINVTSISTATGFVTYNFTALPIVNQFQPGSTVGISGFVAGNSCAVTGGSTTGSVLTINLTGTCVFPTNSTVNIAGVVITGGAGAAGYVWNGTIVKVSSGGTCAAGTCSIQVPSLSTATWSSGGSVTANLNGQCVISSSTTTSITCPTNDDTSTTRVSGGQINSTANLFCAPGGNGDEPPPYDPAGDTEVQQFFPDSFQLIPYVTSPATCSVAAGQTGCFGATCGRLPSQQETLWVQRFEAGIDEREVNGSARKLETGSLFIYTNAGGTSVHKNVWVNSWNPSSVKTGCYTSSTPCADLSHALYALQATSSSTNATGNQVVANLTGTAGSCLVFKNAGNVSGAIPLYDGEAVDFVAYDDNAGANLSQFGLYWIVGVGATETGDANGVAIAAKPGAPCINDTASGIFGGNANAVSTAWLINDVGGDNIYLACDTTLTSPQVPCSHIHPETYDWKVSTSAASTASLYVHASYLNIGPDTTNGVTHDEVSVLNGIGNWFANAGEAAQGGRIHKTADTIDTELSLTPAVALGPTSPIVNVTGGSLATCPSPNATHQCETLTFAANKNPATLATNGATFQAPTATNPLGQAIVVSGVVSSSSATTWNCGTSIAAPCGGSATTSVVVGSTATSVTFINDTPSGSDTWTSGGKITPTDLVVEFTPGTLTTTTCATDGVANDTHLFLTCLGSNNLATGGTPNWLGTNSTSYPLSLNGTTPTGASSTSISRNSNCLYVTGTGDVPQAVGAQTIQAVIPATGGNNDVALLSYSNALTISYYAYNQCDALHFQNNAFSPVGSITDMWYDSETISGPGPYSNYDGKFGAPNTNGAFYATSGTRQSTVLALGGGSYSWGGLSQDAISDCINASFTDISIACANNGQSVLPFALGGSLNSDGTQWIAIVGSLDSTGANVQCGGVDCVSTASVTLKVPTGSIPSFTSVGWGSGIMCNMPTTVAPLTSTTSLGQPLLQYINNDSSPTGFITIGAGGVTSSCNVTSHPAIFLNNGEHIDFDFETFGPALYPGHNFRGTWQTYNNVIQENISGTNMGSMEGWAYQGGRLFNFALEDMVMGLSEFPVPGFLGSFHTIAQSEVGNPYNIILRNDLFGTGIAGADPGYQSNPWIDIFFINDNGGTGQTNFPGSGLLDWKQVGFWNATALTFQPIAGETAVGGITTSFGVWPTGTRGVNATTGLPNAASAAYYNSLLAAPWYGILGDTGLGTQ